MSAGNGGGQPRRALHRGVEGGFVWTGNRNVLDGWSLARLRQELAAVRCGFRGHRYGPVAKVAIFDDVDDPANYAMVRKCMNGCGCSLVGTPRALPARRARPLPPDLLGHGGAQ